VYGAHEGYFLAGRGVSESQDLWRATWRLEARRQSRGCGQHTIHPHNVLLLLLVVVLVRSTKAPKPHEDRRFRAVLGHLAE